MEVIMRLKKFALLAAVLLVFAAFSVNAMAEEWLIIGTVTEAGNRDEATWLVIKDTNGNIWGAPASNVVSDEILNTALVAYPTDSLVKAIYDTTGTEWEALWMVKPQ
jgi:hypothetical protein